ncbi:hypothetical protein DXG01_004375 [Tephrocybe rancida]|nr:hypothetical protein DXG01_004375 [Tephrocybe rancida]
MITPSKVSSVAASHLKHSILEPVRSTAACAILRHGLHASDHFKVLNAKGLHPMFVSLHSRGEVEGNEKTEVHQLISDLREDALDAVSALDRLDGGISVFLRCPGFQAPASMGTDSVTVDLVVPPRELLAPEGGKELSKALALMVQAFGKDVALPYLARFNQRCRAEGVVAPPVPPYDGVKCSLSASAAGKPLKLSGSSHLPTPKLPSDLEIRCQCRSGGAQEVLRDITIAHMSFSAAPIARSLPIIAPLVVAEDACQESKVFPSRKGEAGARPQRSDTTVDNGFSGAIISIGPRTDAVLDRFKLEAQEIPKLCSLSFNERSSKWEEAMRSTGHFSYSYEIASTMAEAMRADLGVQGNQVQGNQVREIVL